MGVIGREERGGGGNKGIWDRVIRVSRKSNLFMFVFSFFVSRHHKRLFNSVTNRPQKLLTPLRSNLKMAKGIRLANTSRKHKCLEFETKVSGWLSI